MSDHQTFGVYSRHVMGALIMSYIDMERSYLVGIKPGPTWTEVVWVIYWAKALSIFIRSYTFQCKDYLTL